MKTKIAKIAALTGATLSISFNALAVEPEPIRLGAIDLTPVLDVDWSDTDNMFKTASNEVDSKLVVIAPSLQAVVEAGENIFSLSAAVTDEDYSEGSTDDFTSVRFGADAYLQMNSRNAFQLSGGTFSTREMRGTGFSQGGLLPSDPDEYEETTAGIEYLYGDEDSFFGFTLGVDTYDKNYDNNPVQTQFREREDDSFTGTVFFNVSPRTALLLEYSNTDVDYTTDPTAVVGAPDSLDSEETYAYVGVTWEASAKTTGTLKVGRGEKEFDDVDRVDADGTVWDAAILWEPLSYSLFTLNAVSGFEEAVGSGNGIDSDSLAFTWAHAWSDSFSHSLNLYTADQDHFGSTRSDEFDVMSLRFDYSMRRWFDVNFSIAREDRESSFDFFDYKENVISLGFTLTL